MSILLNGTEIVIDAKGGISERYFDYQPVKEGYTRFVVKRIQNQTSIEFKVKNTEYLIFTKRRTEDRVHSLITRIARDISNGTFDGIDRYYVPVKNLPYA